MATVTHMYEGEGNGFVIEGLDNTVWMGSGGSRSAIQQVKTSCYPGDQARHLPNMIFKSSGEMVVSTHGSVVWQPNISDFPKYKSSSQGMKPDKVECPEMRNLDSTVRHGYDPVSHARVPLEQDGEDHSRSKTQSKDTEAGTPPLGTNTAVQGVQGKGKMTFLTRNSGMVVQGSRIIVLKGGDDQDAAMMANLPVDPVDVHDMHDMDFRTENCDVCVQGCHTKVFVATGARKSSGGNQPQTRNASTGAGKCSCRRSTSSSATCVCIQESETRRSTGNGGRTSPVHPLMTQDEWQGDGGQPDPEPCREYMDINSIPIAKLPFRVRRELSFLLDVKQFTGADWRSVADSFGVSYYRICHMDIQESPTMSLLHSLQGKGTDVGQLINVLAKLDRKDAVIELTELLESDQF